MRLRTFEHRGGTYGYTTTDPVRVYQHEEDQWRELDEEEITLLVNQDFFDNLPGSVGDWFRMMRAMMAMMIVIKHAEKISGTISKTLEPLKLVLPGYNLTSVPNGSEEEAENERKARPRAEKAASAAAAAAAPAPAPPFGHLHPAASTNQPARKRQS